MVNVRVYSSFQRPIRLVQPQTVSANHRPAIRSPLRRWPISSSDQINSSPRQPISKRRSVRRPISKRPAVLRSRVVSPPSRLKITLSASSAPVSLSSAPTANRCSRHRPPANQHLATRFKTVVTTGPANQINNSSLAGNPGQRGRPFPRSPPLSKGASLSGGSRALRGLTPSW